MQDTVKPDAMTHVERPYPRFSEPEMQRRWSALTALLESRGVAAALIWGAGSFNRELYYLTDWPGGREGCLLFPVASEPALRVQLYNHGPMAKRVSRIADTAWGGHRTYEAMANLCRERGLDGKRLAIVGALPYQHYEHLRAALPGAEWVDLTAAMRGLLTVKSPEELERIRFACELTDRSMESLEAGIKPGVREWELPTLIEPAYLNAGGYAGVHYFASMPMGQPNVCVPAQYPSQRVIRNGDAVITEITGAYWGYSGQIHRTYFLGEPPTSAWNKLHEVAVEAYLRIEAVLREGATVGDVLTAADFIHLKGYHIYDDLFHGLGQLAPVTRTRHSDNTAPESFVFKENMVVVIQPNVITPDERMGLQFGETVLITKTGTQRLNRYRREPILCGQQLT